MLPTMFWPLKLYMVQVTHRHLLRSSVCLRAHLSARPISLWIGLIVSILFSHAAYAQCSLTRAWANDERRRGVLNIPDIMVDPNAEIGAVLWRTTIPNTNLSMNTPVTNSNNQCAGEMATRTSDRHIAAQLHDTDVAGIKYRIQNDKHQLNVRFTKNITQWRWPVDFEMGNLEFQLVKQGPITGGQRIFNPRAGQATRGIAAVELPRSSRLRIFTIAIGSSGHTRLLPCTPDTRDVKVNFGRVSASDLAQGATASKPVAIKLSCNENAKLKVKVKANSDQPMQGMINVNADSTAQGVAVKLEHAGDKSGAVQFDVDQDYGSVNKDQSKTLDFKAQVVRKAADAGIQEGDFTALATISLSYE